MWVTVVLALTGLHRKAPSRPIGLDIDLHSDPAGNSTAVVEGSRLGGPTIWDRVDHQGVRTERNLSGNRRSAGEGWPGQ